MSSFKYKKYTSLLDPEENKDIQHMLGRKCTALVTTVIQLYCTNPPQHSQWVYQDCGILVLVKDSKEKRYFFRLYCLVRKTMVWEYRLDKDIEYTCPRNFLSSFEGQECIYAFNFASTTEARTFNACVLERLSKEHKTSVARQRKTKRTPLSKKNISLPIEPQHNFHIGFKNMEALKMSPKEIESYFEKKNINKKMLQPKPEVVPTIVAPISIHRVNNQQVNKFQENLNKSTTLLNTFQADQENNVDVVPFKMPNLCKSKFGSAPSIPRVPSSRRVTFSLQSSSQQSVVATSQPQLNTNNGSLAIDESLRQLLSRRQQVLQSDDDSSSFSTDDDWDD